METLSTFDAKQNAYICVCMTLNSHCVLPASQTQMLFVCVSVCVCSAITHVFDSQTTRTPNFQKIIQFRFLFLRSTIPAHTQSVLVHLLLIFWQKSARGWFRSFLWTGCSTFCLLLRHLFTTCLGPIHKGCGM